MPQLNVFAVCERCLMDGNIPSLIMLMQKVIARPVVPDKALDANAVAPTHWCVFSQWSPAQEERGVEFSYVIQALWPDKSEFIKHSLPFRFGEKKNHNLFINVTGFPVGKEGEVTINMWLERESQRIADIHSWNIEVEHKAGE